MIQRIRWRIAAIVLLVAATLHAENLFLKKIDCRPGSAGFEVRILCSGPTAYTSLSQNNPPRVEIYLRDVSLGTFDVASLRAHVSCGEIRVDQWRLSPAVLRVTVSLPPGMPYSVIGNESEVVLQVGKMGESESSFPQPLFSQAIPRNGQLRTRLNHLGSAEPISLDLHSADIGNVLRLLAKQNNLNIVASDSVRGKITLSLQQVTVAQALDNILRANGYKYVVDDEVIMVKPARSFPVYEMETKVYRLKHIEAGNVMEAIQDIKSPNGKIKILTPSFQNRGDIYDSNKKYFRREDQYWLRSSVLIVTDIPAHLEAIDKLIQALDVPVPAVMIEARLIEVSPQRKGGIGIEWDKQLSAQIFNIDEDHGPGYAYSLQAAKGARINFATLNTQQFNLAIKFLQEHTNAKLLSNPRILAMDNEPSDISVGTTFPIPSITRGTGGQGDLVTFNYKDVNIALRVIPHVTEDSTVTMYVNPIIEEVTGEVKIDLNTAPITAKREVDTVVKVRSGHTVVIGGLIREKEVRTVKKVWLLGDIPLLGLLFRNTDTEKVQTDLVIFLTPRIIDAN